MSPPLGLLDNRFWFGLSGQLSGLVRENERMMRALPRTIICAVNLAVLWYLSSIIPVLTSHRPGVVKAVCALMMGIGAIQVGIFVVTGQGAGYGKFGSSAVAIPIKVAWWTMEQPAFLVPLVSLFCLWVRGESVPDGVYPLLLFMAHYFQRSFIYPLLTRGADFPVVPYIFAAIFCTLNGTMQVNDLLYSGDFAYSSVHFSLGALIFAMGMALNIHSDYILRNLRQPGEARVYKIPRGGLFEYISGANLVAEAFEWTGYAVASNGCVAPMVFALFGWMGIGCRAVATHRWYVTKFGADYPQTRKQLIPLVW